MNVNVYETNKYLMNGCLLTCRAQPEVMISQEDKQRSAAEKLWEAQWDVSVFTVWIIPTISCSTAEPPQQGNLQPFRETDTLMLKMWMTVTQLIQFKKRSP